MASNAVAAAATYHDNTLFVHYSTPAKRLGALYALSTPAAPSSTDPPNSLLTQFQSVAFKGPNPYSPDSPPRPAPVSVCMVSTSVLDPQTRDYRHDLLLTYNLPQPAVQTQPITPLLFRMTPNIGNVASAQGNATWTLTDESQALGMVPGDVSRLWMASGISGIPGVGPSNSPQLEGSAVYLISGTALSTELNVSKRDVSGTGSGQPSSVIFAESVLSLIDISANHQIVRIAGSLAYDVVVVGRCLPPTRGTCLLLIKDFSVLWTAIRSPIEYDPSSCIATANGLIIMATSSTVWTRPYTTLADWTSRQPPSFRPNLPSPILACTTSGSKLFAVIEGNATTPDVYTIDLASSNWDWQKASLVMTGNTGSGTNPNFGSDNSGESKGLSTTVLAVIIAVAVALGLVLLGLLLFWKRRRSRQKKQAMGDGQANKPFPNLPPTAAAASAAMSGSRGYQPGLTPESSGGSMMHAFGARTSGGLQPGKHDLTETELTAMSTTNGPPPPGSGAWVSTGGGAVSQAPVYSNINNNGIHGNNGAYSMQPGATTSAYPPSSLAQGHPSTMHMATPGVSLPMPVNTPTHPVIFTPAAPPGDKRELSDEDEDLMRPYQPNASPSVENASESSSRLRGMVSPGLANAQLILQRSQTPQNESSSSIPQHQQPQQHQQHHQQPGQYYRA
ncbi:hypothetical protein BGZ70_005735 [Mortierella alpina]|uniref:Uncharacterized protein n=1 Tax=Mortierella alpina TaxID=64518 RepID=A0A9P6J8H8_MORAP|nr:hypothetical protein BGZ70_005735 [Mortierella alpina]